MSHDNPSCSIPSDIDRHTDAELEGLTAENCVLLAFDEDSDDTGVLELAVNCATLDLWGGNDLFWLDA